MADQIPNAGKKGYFLMWFFIALFLFIILWAFIYYQNQSGLQ